MAKKQIKKTSSSKLTIEHRGPPLLQCLRPARAAQGQDGVGRLPPERRDAEGREPEALQRLHGLRRRHADEGLRVRARRLRGELLVL